MKIVVGILMLIVFAGLVHAAGEIVGTQEATVCCEKTNSGLYCQDVPEEDCADDSQFALPTACSSTTPCDPGYCYDDSEGTCLDNVPQMICNDNGGTWSANKPDSCNLGCCVLGDQASFVSLVRCKRLSGFYGLTTNFNPDIATPEQCILEARSDEKGACVFEEDFERTCKLTKRSDCNTDSLTVAATAETTTTENADSNGTVLTSPSGCENVGDGILFCPNMLCSAPELETNCGKTQQTICIEGKEEVYFVDSCGNPANIYDSNKVKDDNYWSYLKDKSESCNPDAPNIDSQSCGNCNYIFGSYCSAVESGGTRPTYGNNICADLNCPASEETGGVERLHGESWCGFDAKRDFTFQENTQNVVTQIFDEALRNVRSKLPINANFKGGAVPVGSKFYRYVCSHGEVITEPCADFRQEECIENEVAGFTEAACRVNRWQDCTSIFKKSDCENTDRRDCVWMDGIEYVLMGGLGNGSTIDKSSLGAAKGELQKIKTGERELGACVPKTPPGLTFWGTEEGDNAEAESICAQANAVCPVTYEKGLIGGDWECVENCECLEETTQLKRAQVCVAMGDCGPKVNIVGQLGRSKGYKIFEEELKSK